MENENQNNQNQNEEPSFGQIFFSWEFPEITRYNRGSLWYFSMGTIMVLLFGYSIFTKNFFFAMIVILFGLLFYVTNKNSKIITIKITEDGIMLGRKFYSYQEIEKFWIIYQPPEVKNLYFRVKSSIFPAIIVPFEDQNPLEVKKILSQYIKEDLTQKEESDYEKWTRILKL